MRLDRDQHVGEAAQDMRADRFAFESAGKRAHARALVGGNTEMVRPEPNEPLDKADLGAKRRIDPQARLFQVKLLGTPGPGFCIACMLRPSADEPSGTPMEGFYNPPIMAKNTCEIW